MTYCNARPIIKANLMLMEIAHFSTHYGLHAKILNNNWYWNPLGITALEHRERLLNLALQTIEWYENFFTLNEEEPYVAGFNTRSSTDVWFDALKHTYEIEYPNADGNYLWYVNLINKIRRWINNETKQQNGKSHKAQQEKRCA